MGLLLDKIIECVAPTRKKDVSYEMKEYKFNEHWYNPACSCIECYNTESMFNPEDRVYVLGEEFFSIDDIIGDDVNV